MADPLDRWEDGDLERALLLVEQALELCDDLGFSFAAIDLCAALEKLKELRAE